MIAPIFVKLLSVYTVQSLEGVVLMLDFDGWPVRITVKYATYGGASGILVSTLNSLTSIFLDKVGKVSTCTGTAAGFSCSYFRLGFCLRLMLVSEQSLINFHRGK